jgi:hypothetical protein
MDIFGRNQPGVWFLSSAKDARWNCHGDVNDLVISDGMTAEAKEALARLKKEYGEPPDDLRYSAWKD